LRIADILEHKGDQVLTVTAETTARVAERLRLVRVGALVVSRDGVHAEGSSANGRSSPPRATDPASSR
jgi:hypothetical protein